MRPIGILATVLVMTTASAAYSQTLNAQMQRMQQRQGTPATTAPQNWPANSTGTASGAYVTGQTAVTPAAPAPAAQPMAPMTTMAPAAQSAAPMNTMNNMGHIDSVGAGAIPALPLEIMSSGGVTYVSGGIGDEERDMLKSREHDFNLKVLLSAPRGEFISNAQLRILDNKGTPLVGIQDAGPYVYANLQPGTYTVEVTASNGEKKSEKVVIGKKAVKKHFVFNE